MLVRQLMPILEPLVPLGSKGSEYSCPGKCFLAKAPPTIEDDGRQWYPRGWWQDPDKADEAVPWALHRAQIPVRLKEQIARERRK